MKPDDFSRQLGQNLKAFRELRGLSAEQAGKLVGLTTDAVYKYERGERQMTVQRLIQCAVALDTNVQTLIQGLDPRNKQDAAQFRELRCMSPEEHGIAMYLASSWDGDVKALMYWAYLYTMVPRAHRGELALPVVMEVERMTDAGQLPAERLQPIVDYVRNATGGLLDVPETDSGEVCPK